MYMRLEPHVQREENLWSVPQPWQRQDSTY